MLRWNEKGGSQQHGDAVEVGSEQCRASVPCTLTRSPLWKGRFQYSSVSYGVATCALRWPLSAPLPKEERANDEQRSESLLSVQVQKTSYRCCRPRRRKPLQGWQTSSVRRRRRGC